MEEEEIYEEYEEGPEGYDRDEEDDGEYGGYANVPQQKEKDDLFSLFGKVWKTPDSSKVSNLSNQELGMLPVSVRQNLYLSLLGTTLKHKDFAKFFKATAEITLATACSKKGWLPELFVSQKKFSSKTSSRAMRLPEKKSKWNIYGKNKQQQLPQV